LRQAQSNLDRGRDDAALSWLDDFMEKVEACLANGMLTTDQGASLMRSAERVKAAVIASW